MSAKSNDVMVPVTTGTVMGYPAYPVNPTNGRMTLSYPRIAPQKDMVVFANAPRHPSMAHSFVTPLTSSPRLPPAYGASAPFLGSPLYSQSAGYVSAFNDSADYV